MAEDTEVRELSFYDDKNYLIEQLAGPGFACYNRETKAITELPFVEIHDPRFKLTPLSPMTVDYGVVLLPTTAMEYNNEAELLELIIAHIHKYLDISPEMERFAAYYVLFSWLYDKFNTCPYLRVTGDTGSGKTRFLDSIGRLCYKPILVSGAATSAPIFRLLENWQGTLVIDEADFAKSDTTVDLVKIMNSGFERFRPVVRCNKENPNDIEIHRVFGPKVIASRYKFFDSALESRCLAEQIRPTGRDIPTNLTKAFFAEEAELRNKLLMYRFRNYDNEFSAPAVLENIEPRLRQMVASFLSIISKDPKMVEDFTTFINKYQLELIEDRADSHEGSVTNAVYQQYEKGFPVTPSEISEMVNVGATLKEKLGPKKIGRVLKSLGLTVKLTRRGEKVSRIVQYDEDRLATIFRRYVPGYIPKPVTSVTNVTSIEGRPPLTPAGPTFYPDTRVEVSPLKLVTNVTPLHLLAMMSKWGADVCPIPTATIIQENGGNSQRVWEILTQLSHSGEVSEVEAGLWILSKNNGSGSRG